MGARPVQRGRAGSASRELLDLAPRPDGGPLTIVVECRTSPRARTGALHEVAIQPDWTLSTPHDVEAERVAAAFGGYTSCLTLIDETIPRTTGAAGAAARAVSMSTRAGPGVTA